MSVEKNHGNRTDEIADGIYRLSSSSSATSLSCFYTGERGKFPQERTAMIPNHSTRAIALGRRNLLTTLLQGALVRRVADIDLTWVQSRFSPTRSFAP